MSGHGNQQDRFVAAVEAIYGAAAVPSRWPDALQAIADCFGDVGANLIYRRDDGRIATIVTPSLAIAQRDYEQNWWQHDPRFSRSIERGYMDGLDVITDRHVCTDDEVENHSFYRGFLAPHGLRWFAGLNISPDRRLGVALAIQRSNTKVRYSNDDLMLLSRLGRHVENALRLGIRLLNAEIANLGLGDALARFRIGVLLLDYSGRVAYSNSAADGLMGSSLTVAAGRLKTRATSEQTALQAAISSILVERVDALPENPQPILVQDQAAGEFLAVYVLPLRLPTREIAERLLAEIRGAVLIVPSSPGEPPDPAIVRDVLGLTLGEARVAALVGSGLPPREAAVQLGIAEETARTTLKRVFGKVGVSRQSELSALLTRMIVRSP
jgi:DNA-binding CsgD family transcriptional regulator